MNDDLPSLPRLPSDLLVIMTHIRALNKGLITRIRCDNLNPPRWWCEVADERVGWIEVS